MVEINEINYELYALDYVEGNLKGEDLIAMNVFLEKHPNIKEEIQLISATYLPESNVVFEGKDLLVKQEKRRITIPFVLSSALAACLVLAIGVLWLFNQHPNYGQVAHKSITINVDLNYFDNYGNNSDNLIADINETKLENSDERFFQTIAKKAKSSIWVEKHSESNENESYQEVENNLSAENQQKIETIKNSKTIEVVTLSTENTPILTTTIIKYPILNDLNRIEDERLALSLEEEEKKKQVRSQIRSVFQNALLPEGISNSINN